MELSGIHRIHRDLVGENMARILVIDDDVKMLSTLRQMLEGAKHEVFEAPDGAVGVSVFQRERPELVITDIFMPEQDGLETILALKNEFPGVKIIAISGGGKNGNFSYLEVARTFGADRVFRKPFTPQVILTAIEELQETSEYSD